MLASLQSDLLLSLALRAFHSEHDLLCGLGLLFEDGLGLTAEAFLFTIVSSLALHEHGVFALFVLCYFV